MYIYNSFFKVKRKTLKNIAYKQTLAFEGKEEDSAILNLLKSVCPQRGFKQPSSHRTDSLPLSQNKTFMMLCSRDPGSPGDQGPTYAASTLH